MSKAIIEYYIVWCTLQRQPLLTSDIERAVFRCIVQQAQRLQCSVLALNGMPDHVHLVIRAPATLSAAQIVKQIKGVSSTFIRKQLRPEGFGWRDGYFVRSLCSPVTAKVITYVELQKQHHADGTLWRSLEMEEEDTPTEQRSSEG